ncbi:zinc ribbon domain-containing protein [Diplocloster agilis]|uniref:Zinc ribbon domain-containing protein n=1 Tax=Diplocloster agilis TaxID=2850323 RepID=A0A949K382_9FIRM|nr:MULTISPECIES: zinc ribbon domain-containing protein [Lachnospiraceae]MBU9739424.1 zinc ribbon domain-containing protein [Diplocloster agilis]MCU6732747.1 zinc ribbon domain-containing protein [Suonthocola fibrivorans]SCI59020.1 DNA-directed RNA polymerase subunit P [uncultured Clostridium sp.]
MVITYKCPNCGAGLEFDSEKQMLVCVHCGTEKSVEEMEQMEQKESKSASQTNDFKMFHCPVCGAEILTDEHTSATFCSYCGSTALIESRLTDELAPAYVIPFQINREQAKEAYLRWTKKGKFTPREFTSQSTIEKISGIYVPYWIYDYDTHVKLRADCTRIRTERRGDTEYTHTDHFDVYREVAAAFEKVPADASEKMDDDVMDRLEPFDYSAMKQFEMPYLSGYLAEKYNFTEDELKSRIEKRIHQYAASTTRETIGGYASVNVLQENVNMAEKKADYVLLPVWMLNYRYQNKNYQFAMNGQTGKIVGKLPASKGRAAAWFAGVAASVFLVLSVIGILL